ncbi:hypothetical protein VXQ18_10955 [Brucella abortus]|nr:hypothetical protein [Brucella abortus]
MATGLPAQPEFRWRSWATIASAANAAGAVRASAVAAKKALGEAVHLFSLL